MMMLTEDMWRGAAACLLTLMAFVAARGAARLAGGHPLANPVLGGALITGAMLWALSVTVEDYVIAARPLMGALDLAIVALGYVLVERLSGRIRLLLPILGALAIGTAFGIASAYFAARLFGLPLDFVQAISAKTVSSGFAIALMERLGGPPPLAAGLVIATGMIGALTVPPLLKWLKLDDDDTLGLSTGLAGHIVGTDMLMRSNAGAGAAAALAMAVAGLIAAVILPLFLS
ncbi:LrgB family protein [Pacificimonas sp. WHA3]|uniref:LrgB family protein n=1 Tax=Pacificimonas pallii TaxID=2827236 RepID=A0ABS6SG05_9SPHN|nr:LrgB family protein [Pacificimonas pallii]MBV7257352.1 LrgB family protein [Pacificimonas pallii]